MVEIQKASLALITVGDTLEEVLLTRRSVSQHSELIGLWQMPGGAIELGESP